MLVVGPSGPQFKFKAKFNLIISNFCKSIINHVDFGNPLELIFVVGPQLKNCITVFYSGFGL